MPAKTNRKPHILFLFADTGGGHRSAAEAIIEAFELEFPGRFTTEMVDFFKDYAPPPLNLAGPTYPAMSKMTTFWEWMFKGSDDVDRMRRVYSALWPYVRLPLYRLIRKHPCDMYISVHPLVNEPLLRALKNKKISAPYMVVVTDLVSTHVAWFNNKSSKVIVPTRQAVTSARLAGLEKNKIQVIGLPVADRFCHPVNDRIALRKKLGWPVDLPMVLMVGGGEGMGPLDKVALAVDEARLPCGVAVITGKNKRMKKRLDKYSWQIPAFTYGFVKEMPDFMQAADILLTKAGPGTISEAFIAGLPIILYHRVPGQEEGNVSYVVDEGAGVWAPDVEDIIFTLTDWLQHPEIRNKVAQTAARLARPQASRDIARQAASLLGIRS
jgi:1,2-diacylglycerol 3-beta-galactosyltransferase